MKTRLLLLTLIGATFSVAAVAQVTSGSITAVRNGAYNGRITIQPPHMLPAVVTGAPYSADMESEHTQTLADGTRITQNRRVEKVYRDSAGRVRTERPFFAAPAMNNPNFPKDIPPLVQIADPVANVEYVLDTQNHVAHCFTVPSNPRSMADFTQGSTAGNMSSTITSRAPSGGGVGGGGSAGTSAPRPRQIEQTQSESLGTQMIEGIEAEGTRWTTTFEAGSVGNDRPIVVTHEMWRSPQLRTVVLSKTTDPRNGDSTMRMTNVNLAEPDPGLFQPPPDYRIVNDTEPVTITFSRQ